MLCVRAARSGACTGVVRAAQFQAVRAGSTVSVWGGDGWRYDKGAFRQWVKDSVVKKSPEERQMYAFLASAFGDCDTDKDGMITMEEFDTLLEIVAALPRRFGFAPSWKAEYGTPAARTQAREAIFKVIDGADGHKPRNKLTMGQFVKWAKTHIAGVVPKLTNTDGDVALRHVGKYTVDQYLDFLDKAVNEQQSFQAAGLYNYLLTSFVEADTGCRGRIPFEQFNELIDIAAKTPRYFQLAPETQDETARRAMFDAMDSTKTGMVTYRKFLKFVREHARAKLAEHAAKQ